MGAGLGLQSRPRRLPYKATRFPTLQTNRQTRANMSLMILPNEVLMAIGESATRARTIYRLMLCNRLLFDIFSPILSKNFNPDGVNMDRKRLLRLEKSGATFSELEAVRESIRLSRNSLGPDDTRMSTGYNPRLSHAVWLDARRFPEYRGFALAVPDGFKPAVESRQCVYARECMERLMQKVNSPVKNPKTSER